MSESIFKKNKKTIMTASTLLTIAAGISLFESESSVTIIENTESSMAPLTIASAWQLEAKKSPNNQLEHDLSKPENTSIIKKKDYTIDYGMIHEEIGKIRLAEDGSIIIDDNTLEALRRAFPSYRLNLPEEMLNEIEAILKEGLPGISGQQAAEIIRKFYEYAHAKKEMASVYRNNNLKQESREEAKAVEKALRSLYLGDELAEQLFDQEDKEKSYMHEIHEIATNKELTPEQIKEEKQELSNQYLASLIHNWESRYQAYQVELSTIEQDGTLDDEETREAIMNLQKESFTIDELRTIKKANVSL